MLSDRHAKENLTPTNAREILEKVAALPLATWNYKAQDKAIRHIEALQKRMEQLEKLLDILSAQSPVSTNR